jgi:hypothetical protein
MPRARSSSPRRPLSIPVLLAVVLAALVVPLAGRATDLRLASAWRGEPIRIDGNDEEWRGRTAPVEGKRFALGLQNDADAIYLCLTTDDRVLATQIARQGLMVWFDPGPERPKKHVFGLHFPIDSRLAAMRDPADRWPRDGGDVSEASQAAVGILRPGKDDPLRVPLDEAGGIVARAAFHGALLVYEVKVPLKGTGAGPYAVAANPGGAFHLELETPEWRGPLPPSRSPIGIGVAASAPGGRGVVGYPSVDATYLKRTDLKAIVQLASGQ